MELFLSVEGRPSVHWLFEQFGLCCVVVLLSVYLRYLNSPSFDLATKTLQIPLTEI